MGLLDIFTGDPAKKAAQQQRAFLDQTRTQNNATIQGGLSTSLANIGQGFGNARTALSGGGDAVNTGYGDAQGFLSGGANAARGQYDASRGYLGQAGDAFAPLSGLAAKYGGGTNLYLDSLGVNGAEGNTRAGAAFQPSQAYNFNLDQGLEAISRRRNAGGMLNSGNADRDAQVFGAGLASNEMKGWQDRLAGLINPELAATTGAATGQAGAFTNLANLGVNQAGMESTLGQNQAGLSTGRAAMLSDLQKAYAQNYTGEAGALAGLNTNAANAQVGNANQLAAPYANTYGQEAAAQTAGSGALWGGLLGLTNLGLKASGVGGFGAPAISNLGNASNAPAYPNPYHPSGTWVS